MNAVPRVRISRTVVARIAFALHAALPTLLLAQRDLAPHGTREWTVREALVAREIGGSFRWPSLAAVNSQFVLVADVWSDLNASLPETADPILWRLPDSIVAMPSQVNPGYHSLVADQRGRIHLFWSEHEGSERSRSSWIPLRTNITHSRLDSAGWSTNDTVVRGASIGWRGGTAQLAMDSDDNVHVVTSVVDSLGYTLSAFKLRGQKWVRSDLAPGGLHTAVVSAGPNTLVVASLGIGGIGDSVPLRVIRTTSNGDHWTAPTIMSMTALGTVSHLQLIESAGSLVAIWIRDAASQGSASLMTSWSRDAGQSWSEPHENRLPDLPRRVTAVADGCGGFVALLETRSALANGTVKSSILQATMSSDYQTSLFPVFTEFPSVFDSALARHEDRLLAVFVGARGGVGTSNFVAERNACVRLRAEVPPP